MKLEKHLDSLNEVLDEIHVALQDSRGTLSHQRRLALMLSLGVCDLIEIYFHKLKIIKTGSRLKHDWFKQKRIKEKLETQIIVPIDTIKEIEPILLLGAAIEESRDDLAYGSPLNEEFILNKKINQFLELKKIIEKTSGELNETE